jgi:hypothetical protein
MYAYISDPVGIKPFSVEPGAIFRRTPGRNPNPLRFVTRPSQFEMFPLKAALGGF